MSKLQEIEQAVEQLPMPEFLRLASWIDQKREQIHQSPSTRTVTRDHSSFLSGYAPEDEGLYDDAKTR